MIRYLFNKMILRVMIVVMTIMTVKRPITLIEHAVCW